MSKTSQTSQLAVSGINDGAINEGKFTSAHAQQQVSVVYRLIKGHCITSREESNTYTQYSQDHIRSALSFCSPTLKLATKCC